MCLGKRVANFATVKSDLIINKPKYYDFYENKAKHPHHDNDARVLSERQRAEGAVERQYQVAH